MSTESTDKLFNFPTYAVFYKGILHAMRDLGFHLFTPQPSWAYCGILGDIGVGVRKENSDCPVHQLNLSEERPDLDSTHYPSQPQLVQSWHFHVLTKEHPAAFPLQIPTKVYNRDG